MEIVFFLLMQFLRHVFKVALKELIYLLSAEFLKEKNFIIKPLKILETILTYLLQKNDDFTTFLFLNFYQNVF